MVIIIGGLCPTLAVLTFARLRTIFFSFNKKHSSHAKSKAKIVFIKKTRPVANRSRDYVDVDSDLRRQLSKGNTLDSYSSTNDE